MSNRIIYYYQTFCGLDDILNQTPIVVTHIHLSSIHFGVNLDKSPYIHLNNYPPDNPIFKNVWSETKKASELGIKIILMIGGAGLAYNTLFYNYNTYYNLLKQTIKNYPWISGIDLDIEESVDIKNIKKLINQIDRDFGKDFIITMAPLASSLSNDEAGMGGFVYKDLYNSLEGQRINWFNGQFYGNFTKDTYDNIINNGYPANKVVMGMLSEDFPSSVFQLALNEIKCISKIYDNFGGVFVWEYFNCPPDIKDHSIWAKDIKQALINKDNFI